MQFDISYAGKKVQLGMAEAAIACLSGPCHKGSLAHDHAVLDKDCTAQTLISRRDAAASACHKGLTVKTRPAIAHAKLDSGCWLKAGSVRSDSAEIA